MRSRGHAWLPLAALLIACAPPTSPPVRAPLALETPVEAIARDLQAFVPRRLAELGVAGIAIAVVRDAELVWSGGFGVRNALTRAPVRSDTVFEVASHSKPVAAYAALRLAEQGRLDLDRPAGSYLSEPFVPPSPAADRITLRHLLTHSSGLSNIGVGLWTDRRIHFPPGDRLSYSGHGFDYLGTVLASVSGKPVALTLRETVLGPLAMQQSGYHPEDVPAGQLASGHISAAVALSTLGVPALLLGLVIWPIACLAVWLGRLPRRGVLALAFALNAIAGFLLGALALGAGRAAVCAALAMAACGLGWVCTRLARRGLAELQQPRPEPRTPRLLGRAAGSALALLGIAVLVTRSTIPLPARHFDLPAVGGLLSTAPDLAQLMIELMDPALARPASVAEMLRPAIRGGERVSWGLGIGIQHGDEADAFWHWGMNPGFESLMVGFPAERIGIVVLTNGGRTFAGLSLAREIASRAIGGEHYGYWADVPGAGLPAER